MTSPADQFESPYFRLEPAAQVAIVRFSRQTLSEEDNVEQLGQELLRLVDQLGYRRVVISLKQVAWVTSSILGKLIHLHRHLQRNQGDLALCEIEPNVSEILATSRLNSYFHIYPTVDLALAGWQTSEHLSES